MAEKLKRLGDAELEIMLILCQTKEPVTSTYILEHLKEKRKWALSTLMTTLARLADKGYVCCDRSTRTNYYTAIVEEAVYKQRESHSFLEKLFGNSLSGLVVALYDSKSVSQKDLQELRVWIDELDERKKDDIE